MASYTEVIPPGKVGTIDAQLDTSKLHGSVGRGITVYTNDPVHPKFFLTVNANVIGGVTLIPHDQIVLTNRSPVGRERTLVIRREESETEPLSIADVRVSADWLSVAVVPVEGATIRQANQPVARPGDWWVTVSIDEGAPYGRHQESLKFSTGLSRQAEVEVPVDAMLIPPVSLSQERIELPAGDGGQASGHTVLLSVRRGLDPATLHVESSPEALTADLERSGNRGYKLHVGWNSSDPPSGEITLRVGKEEVRLPVSTASSPSGS